MVSELPALPLDEELLELELLDNDELDELLDDELELLLEELELDGFVSPSPPQATSADATTPVRTSCSFFMRVPKLLFCVAGSLNSLRFFLP